MPRTVEYPRRSLKDALNLAETVSRLGGKCSVETCAESMKKRVSGSFSALANAAVKYGLVTSKSGELAVTDLFNEYRWAYTEEEKQKLLRQAFLNAPLFNQVFTRFRNEKLPGDILTKVLIREFDVKESLASAVHQYFLEGALKPVYSPRTANSSSPMPQNETSSRHQTMTKPATKKNVHLSLSPHRLPTTTNSASPSLALVWIQPLPFENLKIC